MKDFKFKVGEVELVFKGAFLHSSSIEEGGCTIVTAQSDQGDKLVIKHFPGTRSVVFFRVVAVPSAGVENGLYVAFYPINNDYMLTNIHAWFNETRNLAVQKGADAAILDWLTRGNEAMTQAVSRENEAQAATTNLIKRVSE